MGLNASVRTGKCVGPISLPAQQVAGGESDIPVGTDCWVTGWGVVNTTTFEAAEVLQEGQVQIQDPNTTCGVQFENFSDKRMLCAGGHTKTGQFIDSCFGDSGGPLVCNRGGKWKQYGVVAFGGEDCVGYAAYTRVASFHDWIHETIYGGPVSGKSASSSVKY